MDAMVNSDDDRPGLVQADGVPAGAEPSPTTRVLLVDDEALMRAGLRLMIDGAEGIEVVGEASDGEAGIAQARDLQPDVILMDVRMPRMDGIGAVRVLRELGSGARVVMLTAFDTDEFLLDALRAGAVSFLLKDSPPEQVVAAVLDAAHDRARFSPEVLARLVRLASGGVGVGPRGAAGHDAAGADAAGQAAGHGADGSVGTDGGGAADDGTSDRPVPPPPGITEREWQVGRLVARGMTNQEIGEELFLSLATVKTHLGRLFDKLRVTNRVQLAIRVLELEG